MWLSFNTTPHITGEETQTVKDNGAPFSAMHQHLCEAETILSMLYVSLLTVHTSTPVMANSEPPNKAHPHPCLSALHPLSRLSEALFVCCPPDSEVFLFRVAPGPQLHF